MSRSLTEHATKNKLTVARQKNKETINFLIFLLAKLKASSLLKYTR
ncbi:hypothetical protein Cabys_653 [Caldithrix abyssi DSM 13497]|uniref:Uncharacterized protein n=1 Tax=Caldithrix abyssi DSM 13497 TaxID=880073 RepID=A0A1J1C4R4_CALAY|nr:hypothetical protein Cabys_653 [Caldithrix abyssi DSM 13497]